MHTRQLIAFALSLLTFTPLRGAEPATDPFLGKWVLDVKASTYPAHLCPKRMLIEMTREARGVHYHSRTEPPSGEPFEVDYVANYDGKPAVVTGDRGILLPVTLVRHDARHVVATYANAFQIVARSDRTISDDGKLMTIVTVSHDSFGQNHTSTGVYQRETGL